VNNLTKNYTTYLRRGLFKREKKIVQTLKGISFIVNKGEVFGLLGPNGAGKTTTVKILSTLLLPDSGEAKILGYDVVKEAPKVRKVIGVSLTVEKGFFWKLTGRENLIYFGSTEYYYNIPRLSHSDLILQHSLDISQMFPQTIPK
jgi:ABC-2 type transport system ATP-binding protein